MTLFIRTVRGNPEDPGENLADGWRLMQRVNGEIRARWPQKISIAEDMRESEWLPRSDLEGGAGFHAQWGAAFAHAVRDAIVTSADEGRNLDALRAAITTSYSGDAFRRVVYTESHDEVANGRVRVPHDIWPGNPGSWFSRKRSTLGAVMVLTSPGVPMLFQGQEFLEDEWFRDTDPLDWSKKERFQGVFKMYQDLVRMRLDGGGGFAGLRGHGVNVFHINHADKVMAYHRWNRGGPGDDVLVVLNLANRSHDSYAIGFPRGGWWRVRFNSDWTGYGADFGNHLGYDTLARDGGRDGLAFHGNIGIGPYSALILTQE
jgi:1,4-alpha-glucan branching enzyme